MPDLSYDQIDALVDVDPIALRDLAWKLTQDVARLEAERDEALRLERQAAHELGLTVAERDEARAAQLRYLRELTATCSCGTSPMTYEGPEPDCAVHGAVRAFNEAAAELARMRPVYDAAVERAQVLRDLREFGSGSDGWYERDTASDHAILAAVDQTAPSEASPPDVGSVSTATLGLIAAATGTSGATEFSVEYDDDQTAPSSPLETPHTADGGEAGVVEGAGGSEAAEAVYEAAIRLLSRKADIGIDPVAWLVPTDLLRELIDAVAPLLIAEGRRQAARQIIARDEAEGDWDINVAYWAAVRIAEGTDDA